MDKPANIIRAGLQSQKPEPHQLSIMFDAVELQGMNSAQRTRAMTHLASLLLQAAGVVIIKECDDDER